MHLKPQKQSRAACLEIVVNETVIKIRPTLGGAATLSTVQGRLCDSHLPVARAHWSCSERIKKNKTVNITYDASRRRQMNQETY